MNLNNTRTWSLSGSNLSCHYVPHQFTWLAVLTRWLPLPADILLWWVCARVLGQPNQPFLFEMLMSVPVVNVLCLGFWFVFRFAHVCLDILYARTSSKAWSPASCPIQKLLCKNAHMKVKAWCLRKSQQAFKGYSVFKWVLRHSSLAFPQALNRDSACSLCPWNTLFICCCLLYASLPFTKLLPSQGNDSKHGLFALKSNTVFNNSAVWNKHKRAHMFLQTSRRFQSVLAAGLRYGGTGGCNLPSRGLHPFISLFIWQDHTEPNVEISSE